MRDRFIPMCTLIIGVDVVAPGTVILAGNRDEDPGRPSRGPDVLSRSPRVVGGSDAVAGGTWMAVRERRAAVAMLNRWPGDSPAPASGDLRSRGRLTLDLAGGIGVHANLGEFAAGWGSYLLAEAQYAPLNMVFASPSVTWLWSHRGDEDDERRGLQVPQGWHVLTHRELDDPHEPRAAYLKQVLDPWRPGYAQEAREGLMELLASHDPPRVCLHRGRMVTVSSFVVWLARDEARYHHLDGRPCERPLTDWSHLLDGSFDAGE